MGKGLQLEQARARIWCYNANSQIASSDYLTSHVMFVAFSPDCHVAQAQAQHE